MDASAGLSQAVRTLGGIARLRMRAVCAGCGRVESRWVGRCPGCEAWGTMVEQTAPLAAAAVGGAGTSRVPAPGVPLAVAPSWMAWT